MTFWQHSIVCHQVVVLLFHHVVTSWIMVSNALVQSAQFDSSLIQFFTPSSLAFRLDIDSTLNNFISRYYELNCECLRP